MMNIRKLLYLPTEAQKNIIAADIKHILENCDKIATQEWKEQKENQEMHDTICPHCKARKEYIVNKMKYIYGDGKVSGSFYLGFGNIGGSFNLETSEILHCNKCGNEWLKFKTKYVNMTDILRVTLNYLGDIFENPEHNTKLSWKLEAIQVFDGCCAESIMILVTKHSNNLRIVTKSEVTISRLRKHYKSVFDKNKKKLEKI